MTTAELRELLAKASMSVSTRAAVNELLAAAEERDALLARFDAAPIADIANDGKNGGESALVSAAVRAGYYNGTRIALVELPAPPVAGGGEQSKGEES